MIKTKLKQLFCDHYFQIDIFKTYNSVGDKANGIVSAEIQLICIECGKVIKAIDRQCKYMETLMQNNFDKLNLR